MDVTLDDLRRHALARSLFKPTTLPRAIAKLGFVQADPIRAPARAQDLTLRHRVAGYRAGDLERRYARLPIEEDFFVNYGFLPRATHHLMHPRTARSEWTQARWTQAHEVLAFVKQHGVVHPREVDAAFDHGKTRNWFGGSSNASNWSACSRWSGRVDSSSVMALAMARRWAGPKHRRFARSFACCAACC